MKFVGIDLHKQTQGGGAVRGVGRTVHLVLERFRWTRGRVDVNEILGGPVEESDILG